MNPNLAGRFQTIYDRCMPEWDEANLSAYSLLYNANDPQMRHFVREFKRPPPTLTNGPSSFDLSAALIAVQIVVACIRKFESNIREEYACKFIAAAPGSEAGPARPTAEWLCEQVAEEFDFLTHTPGALVRTHRVPAAHNSSWFERTNMQNTSKA